MRVTFTTSLNKRTVVKSEIQGMFTDIATWFNTTPMLDQDNFESSCVEFRHTLCPLDIMLFKEFGGSAVAFSGVFTVYYVLTDSILTINVQHTELDNLYEEDMPVIQIKALVYDSYHTNIAPANQITRYCIGVSTDGGTTWTPLASRTSRAVDTSVWRYSWFAGLQAHYLTGVAGYSPFNYMVAVKTSLICSCGGDVLDVGSDGARKFAIMANSNIFGDGWIYGEIEANVRWLEQTP